MSLNAIFVCYRVYEITYATVWFKNVDGRKNVLPHLTQDIYDLTVFKWITG